MNTKNWIWKTATVLAVGLLLANPELWSLALFIDAVGLDLFVMLIQVQVVAVSGYYFQVWIKPLLMPFSSIFIGNSVIYLANKNPATCSGILVQITVS